MKCGIITDIHYGPDRGTKKGSAALKLLQNYTNFIEQEQLPFIIDMGDRISDVSQLLDAENLKTIADFFSNLPVETHHVLGNHDVAALSIKEHERIMGRSFESYSFVKEGVSFIIWNANTLGYNQNGFTIPEEQINWLEEELKKASFPTVIISHAPLDSGDMIGNFYFENDRFEKSGYPADKASQIRQIIEKSEKVILCLNGHTHWNKHHVIDGIHYVTIPSLTETFMTYPDVHAAWATLEINKNIHIEIYGQTPLRYELPIRNPNEHWIHLSKSYSPIKEVPQ